MLGGKNGSDDPGLGFDAKTAGIGLELFLGAPLFVERRPLDLDLVEGFLRRGFAGDDLANRNGKRGHVFPLARKIGRSQLGGAA